MAKVAESDAIALLKADHRKVEDLFAKFERAKGNDQKQRLAKEICTELTIHTIIEEEIFYPACKETIKEPDLIDESLVEHDGAKMLVGELEAGSPDAEFYDAKMSVLSEMIKHHVKEEEKRGTGVFAQARAAGLDLDELGARMAARKQELAAKFESTGLPRPEMRTMTSLTAAE
jgi:hemerythrin superfamily protein